MIIYHLVHIQTLILCSLWISTPPTMQTWLTSCPQVNWDWGTVEFVDWDKFLMIRAVEIDTGITICQIPAYPNLDRTPCHGMTRMDKYRLELIWLDAATWLCTASQPEISSCAEPPVIQEGGRLEWRGPWTVSVPEPVIPCELPIVNNNISLATSEQYDFLTGRLAWWGVQISPLDWQNRFDEQIRGAAVSAGVPAVLLKSMIAAESQYWPLWTGDAGEVGWLQLTPEGADTALRHNEQLFGFYCPQAINPIRCFAGYDLLMGWEQSHVIATLMADLRVEGTPVDAADQAAADLWTSAQVLRGFACYAGEIAPGMDTWEAALVLYNAGAGCLATGSTCPEGQEYLRKLMIR
jgi:hypothetical protein